MRWSEAITLQFVKIYLKHECLWNPAHSGYKTKLERDRAYIKIMSEFNATSGMKVTIPELKMKIKNLRTTYSQTVHKIMKKSGPDSVYQPTLVWFHEMDRCLKNVSASYKSFSSLDSSIQQDTDMSLITEPVWMDIKSQSTNTEEENDDNSEPLISHTEDEYMEDPIPHLTQSVKRIRKPKRRKLKRKIVYVSDSNSEPQIDEFDVYGKYLATQLRQLSLAKALQVQNAIQNLVNEARLSELGAQ